MVSVDRFDGDERAALAGMEPELTAMRARHDRDPEVELLRAARAGILPEDLQDRMSTYLASSRWSRALLDGLEDAETEAALDEDAVSRVLARVKSDPRPSPRLSFYWMWPVVATAAAALVVATTLLPRQPMSPRTANETPPASQPQPPASSAQVRPSYLLTLEKPEIKVSLGALTWRGDAEPQRLLNDLKPAFDAFRADRYDVAEKRLGALERSYPASVEVFFYRGVSRLFAGDYDGAIESLTNAARLSDATFAHDIAWYRAIAEERSGRLDAVRTDLTTVCRGGSARAATACDLLGRLR